jgi:hypothetical protein
MPVVLHSKRVALLDGGQMSPGQDGSRRAPGQTLHSAAFCFLDSWICMYNSKASWYAHSWRRSATFARLRSWPSAPIPQSALLLHTRLLAEQLAVQGRLRQRHSQFVPEFVYVIELTVPPAKAILMSAYLSGGST